LAKLSRQAPCGPFCVVQASKPTASLSAPWQALQIWQNELTPSLQPPYQSGCFSGNPWRSKAVVAVNNTTDKMGSAGELREFNRAFKDARKVDPAIRYFDYIHARKAAMLEALARTSLGDTNSARDYPAPGSFQAGQEGVAAFRVKRLLSIPP
jgi:hypothetical protein